MKFPENRYRHCYTVGKVMYNYAKEVLGWNEDKCIEMYTLGQLHDIGYDFDDSPDGHAEVLANALAESYKYSNEIKYHTKLQQEYQSEELDLLYYANMVVDDKGRVVSFEERLLDLASHYGAYSEVHLNATRLVAYLKSKGFKPNVYSAIANSNFEELDATKGIRVNDYIVFNSETPHTLFIGSAGSGLSTQVSKMIVDITSKYSPKEVCFWIADNDRYSCSDFIAISTTNRIPHNVFYCDLRYTLSSQNFMSSLMSEISMRMALLEKYHCKNYTELRKYIDIPRGLVMICDYGLLSTTLKEFLNKDLLVLGRPVGIHVVVFSHEIPDRLSLFANKIALQSSNEIKRELFGDASIPEVYEQYGFGWLQQYDNPIRKIPLDYISRASIETHIDALNIKYRKDTDSAKEKS